MPSVTSSLLGPIFSTLFSNTINLCSCIDRSAWSHPNVTRLVPPAEWYLPNYNITKREMNLSGLSSRSCFTCNVDWPVDWTGPASHWPPVQSFVFCLPRRAVHCLARCLVLGSKVRWPRTVPEKLVLWLKVRTCNYKVLTWSASKHQPTIQIRSPIK